MFEAKIKSTGDLISVTNLIQKYGQHYEEKNIEIICPECSKKLFVYGSISLRVKARFHHYKGQECPLSVKDVYLWGKPDGLALEKGKALRKEVSQVETLKQVYTFCNNLCGKKKRLTAEKFCSLIDEADRRNIWAYQDLPFWVVPFLLLALEDFEGKSQDRNKTFKFRFVIQDGPPRVLRHIWEKGGYFLLRVFDGGNIMKFPPGNPYPINLKTWDDYSQNSDWLLQENYKPLLEALKKCFIQTCKEKSHDPGL